MSLSVVVTPQVRGSQSVAGVMYCSSGHWHAFKVVTPRVARLGTICLARHDDFPWFMWGPSEVVPHFDWLFLRGASELPLT